jgi:hypothetical protein
MSIDVLIVHNHIDESVKDSFSNMFGPNMAGNDMTREISVIGNTGETKEVFFNTYSTCTLPGGFGIFTGGGVAAPVSGCG